MATTESGIYYQEDYNADADVLRDMQKMAESIEDKIIKQRLDATQQDITNIKKEQETQNSKISDLEKNDAQQDKSIEALQKENTELKEECSRLRQDLNAFPSGQAEGEYITLKDSADSRFNMFRVGGNSKQETRSGKNKLNLKNIIQKSYCNIEVQEDKLIVTPTDDNYAGFFIVECNLKAGNYYVHLNSPVTTFNLVFSDSENNNLVGNLYTSATITPEQDVVQIRINMAANQRNYTLNFEDLYINEGTSDLGYEPYGAMPSPEYPSEIQNIEGNINVSVCNKNFFKILNNINKDYITVNSNNTFTINGTLQQNESFAFSNIRLKKGIYTFSLGDYSKITNCYYNIKDFDTNEVIKNFNYTDVTINIDKDRYLELSFVIMAATYNNVLITPQIEAGGNKSTWIEHQEQNFTFSLQEGQRLMLGDYLAKDGIHHVRKQVVLDGTENWMVSGNSYYLTAAGKKLRYELTKGKMLCTHFKETTTGVTEEVEVGEFFEGYYSKGNRNVFFNYYNGEGGVKGFKSYLSQQKQAGTPVTIEYELAEEEIEAYTPEQQKAYEQIVQTAKSYKNVTNIYSPDPVSPVFEVDYRKDIETLLTQQNALILEGGN